MKAVIIEDETTAATALSGLLGELAPQIEVVVVLQSVEESIEWFRLNPSPDVVFMDIHLADGSSFGIFESIHIECPVIFTTAYDEYALKAFEVNSIDYLLKPISSVDMKRALGKLNNRTIATGISGDVLSQVITGLRNRTKYISTLLVAEKDKLIPIAVSDIAYIYIDMKMVRAVTFPGRDYILDQNLDELTGTLDPMDFFRANRQFIISRNAVSDLSIWFGGKIALNLSVPVNERIIVSKARSRELKEWLSGKGLPPAY